MRALENAVMVVVAPLIGLAWVILMPSVGLVTLVWLLLQALRQRP